MEERLKIDKTLPCVQHFSAEYNTTRGVHNTVGQRVSESKDRGWFSCKNRAIDHHWYPL